MSNDHYDIGIITVIGAELHALQDALGINNENDQLVWKGSAYWTKKIESTIGKLSIIIHCIVEPGKDDAAAATSSLIERFNPKMVLLMGIAAGMKGQCKIGDVFVPFRIVDDGTRVAEDGGLKDRPEIFRPPHNISQMLVSFRKDDELWKQYFKEIFSQPVTPEPGKESEYRNNVSEYPNFYDSALASANILIKDPNLLHSLQDIRHQQIRIGDMEAGGFVKAAQQRTPPVPWMIVRAVSDFGDSLKNDEFHRQASCAAASYVKLFLLHGFSKDFFAEQKKHSESSNVIQNEIFVSSIITNYSIARNNYTDILFQHGIDKIYYYGVEGSYNECNFIHYLPKNINTFGLALEKNVIYDPINMIKIGCDINAHVDLNYEKYFQLLRRTYDNLSNDNEKILISRIIGLFQPYARITVPVLNVNSIRAGMTTRSLPERIEDLNILIQQLQKTQIYREYQNSFSDIGKLKNLSEVEYHKNIMKEILEELILYANSISNSVSVFLKIIFTTVYFLISKKKEEKEFNPLLLNMEPFHKQAAISALDRIIIR
jgi:nucleoside phosphorylase